MAPILQKPGQGGQIKDLKLSTRRGALQNLESFARCFAPYNIQLDEDFL
jgi:hypothetical protein